MEEKKKRNKKVKSGLLEEKAKAKIKIQEFKMVRQGCIRSQAVTTMFLLL